MSRNSSNAALRLLALGLTVWMMGCGAPAQESAEKVPAYDARTFFETTSLGGANDPRALQVESDEIVEAVRKNGVPVEYLIFEDEGHGFRNKANRIEASDKYVQFLNRYLKGQEPEGEPTKTAKH